MSKLVAGYKEGVAPAGAAGSPYATTNPASPVPGPSVATEVENLVNSAPSTSLQGIKQIAKVEVDYTDIAAVADVEFGPEFPDNSFVVRAYYEVTQTFTSGGGDAATIGIGFNTDDPDGIVANTAISAGGNIWDGGTGTNADYHEGIQDGAATNFSLKLTAARKLEFTRGGGQALTAGHMVVFVEWVQSV